jgi:hypothetical protein
MVRSGVRKRAGAIVLPLALLISLLTALPSAGDDTHLSALSGAGDDTHLSALSGAGDDTHLSALSGAGVRPHSSLGERTPSEIEGSGDWMPRGPQRPGS